MNLLELLFESDDAITATPAEDGWFLVSCKAATSGVLAATMKTMVYQAWKKKYQLKSKTGLTITTDFKGTGFKVKATKEQVDTLINTATSSADRNAKAAIKKKETAPERKKAAAKVSAVERKADLEKYDKLYGKGTWNKVTYRQEGGDDGYQYVVKVNGRAVMHGLTRSSAMHQKKVEVDKLAKAGKLGKYAPLQEARGVEQVTIHNMAGQPKKFKQIDGVWEKSAEAKAWMKSHDNPAASRDAARRQKEREKEDAIYAKADKKPAIDLAKVYRIAIDAISSSFPDGDPIDHMIPVLRKMGVDRYEVGDTINAAMKKHGHGVEKKGIYPYMDSMWKEMAQDALFDAKSVMQRTGKEYDSPFITYKDGKPVAKPSPY